MKTKTLVVSEMLVIAALFFVAVVPVCAEYEDKPKNARMNKRQEVVENLIDNLGLSQEQVEQIKKNKKAEIEKNRELHASLREYRQELKSELEKPESDNAEIERIAKSIKSIQADMVDVRIENVLKVKLILTPEQFREFAKKLENRRIRKMHNARKEKGFSGFRSKL